MYPSTQFVCAYVYTYVCSNSQAKKEKNQTKFKLFAP